MLLAGSTGSALIIRRAIICWGWGAGSPSSEAQNTYN